MNQHVRACFSPNHVVRGKNTFQFNSRFIYPRSHLAVRNLDVDALIILFVLLQASACTGRSVQVRMYNSWHEYIIVCTNSAMMTTLEVLASSAATELTDIETELTTNPSPNLFLSTEKHIDCPLNEVYLKLADIKSFFLIDTEWVWPSLRSWL